MQLIDDAEISTEFMTWTGRRDPNGPTFGPKQNAIIQDDRMCSIAVEAIGRYFPFKVAYPSGMILNVNASLFEQMRQDGTWFQAGVAGYARQTNKGFWVLLSATMVDRLRWMSLMLFGNPDFRKVAALDELPNEFMLIGSELMVTAGLEFLIFHELGHITSGHCRLKLNLQDREYGIPALELEADLFAAMRMAESCITSRLQVLPSMNEWRNIPDHYFSALTLMGVFATFGLLAVERQTDGRHYPPFKVRFFGFCNEFMVYYDEMGGAKGKDILAALGLVRFASSGIPMVLKELEAASTDKESLNQFAVFKGSNIKEVSSDVRLWMDEMSHAMEPYQAVLNKIRPGYMNARTRRTRREIWDSNW